MNFQTEQATNYLHKKGHYSLELHTKIFIDDFPHHGIIMKFQDIRDRGRVLKAEDGGVWSQWHSTSQLATLEAERQ